MTKRILMIVTSHDHIDGERLTGLWFEEFAMPYQIFRDQNYSIIVASPKGGQAPIDPSSFPVDEKKSQLASIFEVLAKTVALHTIDPNQFDAVFLPGGHGTMFDMPSAEVGQIIGAFADAGKVIGAVCHGPAGFVSAQRADGRPVVQGFQLTGFTNDEEDAAKLTHSMPFLLQDKLVSLGAEFVSSPMWNDHVVIDRNLVTGQNPQSSQSTATAIVDILEKARV